MDTVTFISQSVRQVQLRLLATCDGLTQEQVLWRPTPIANNIGFILWHVARGQDRLINRLKSASEELRASQEFYKKGASEDLWASQEFYKTFGQPIDSPDPGDRMGFQSLAIPELSVLTDYLKAAHEQTLAFLSTLTPDDLDTAPDPSQPERTLAASLRHLITHMNNHHGQVDYIRGLQDDSWDLPMGTGIVLPS